MPSAVVNSGSHERLRAQLAEARRILYAACDSEAGYATVSDVQAFILNELAAGGGR